MSAKTHRLDHSQPGKLYIDSLSDGRQVWIGDEHVESLADRTPIKYTIETIAKLLDFHFDPEARTLLLETDVKKNKTPWYYRQPESSNDLKRLGEVSTFFGSHTFGMMAGLFDVSAGYVNSFSAIEDDIAKHSDKSADVIGSLFKQAKNGAELCCVAFVDPINVAYGKCDSQLSIVGETPDALIVQGTKSLCTNAIYSDRLIILTANRDLHRLSDEQVLGFHVRPNIDGLKIVSRAPLANNSSSQHIQGLDEIDSTLIFDNVHVPKSHFFYSGDRELSELYWNAMTKWDDHPFARRILTKVNFLNGITHCIAEELGISKHKPVQALLLELASTKTIMQELLEAAENKPSLMGDNSNIVLPDPLLCNLAIRQYLVVSPKLFRALELFGGQASVVAPTTSEINNSEIRELLVGTVYSDATSMYNQAALLSLFKEMVISEFGIRQKLLDYYALGGIGGAEAAILSNFDASEDMKLISKLLRK